MLQNKRNRWFSDTKKLYVTCYFTAALLQVVSVSLIKSFDVDKLWLLHHMRHKSTEVVDGFIYLFFISGVHEQK